MKKMHPVRHLLLALPLLLGQVPAAQAQVSVGIGINLPGVDIGINLPAYPQLVPVPGYPVYYAPDVSSNYFFYDGLYWVYQDDGWYSSDWYDGPWGQVQPAYVPLFVLRVPVRYYQQPPEYFGGWRPDAPPRWGDHWGRDWSDRHRGWDRWDRRAAPPPAPLPVYQRNYSGDRYPRAPALQRAVRAENYGYQPREAVSRQQFQRPAAPAPTIPTTPPRGSARPDVREGPAPQRPVPPPSRETQRPQPGEQGQSQVQAPRPQVQPDRPQGRPERSREQPVQAPERARPEQQPQRSPQGREPDQGGRGEAQQDRGRGGPPEGRGRDKKGD